MTKDPQELKPDEWYRFTETHFNGTVTKVYERKDDILQENEDLRERITALLKRLNPTTVTGEDNV